MWTKIGLLVRYRMLWAVAVWLLLLAGLVALPQSTIAKKSPACKTCTATVKAIMKVRRLEGAN